MFGMEKPAPLDAARNVLLPASPKSAASGISPMPKLSSTIRNTLLLMMISSASEVVRAYLSREDFHLFQVANDSKFVSVGIQSPTEINAPRGCAVIL